MPATSMSNMVMHLISEMSAPDSDFSRMMRGEELPPDDTPKEPSRWDLRQDGRNVAHQHIPGFVTGFEPEDVPFDTVEELLNLPFVAHWTTVRDNFHRFSMTRGEGFPHLMAELDNGATWWVVATLDRDVPELPTWQPKK
jgi:hypothetical protein